jgi:hypothetical protein
MKISLVFTIHNRTPAVSKQVADSFRLPGNRPDEVVVVLDRAVESVREGARAAWDGFPAPVRFITIPGEPVWKSPVKAWNFGFAAATGDVLYCCSSEVVQEAWNVENARRLLATPAVLHGKAECSCGPSGQEVSWGDSATPGNLLCDARHPRPLGFIWAAPAVAVHAIGGFDEEFDKGLWYDDDDFFLRLWQQGLDFLFTDEVAGTHLHHERPGLVGDAAAAAIVRNQRYYLSKHGALAPWQHVPHTQEFTPTATWWRHPTP